MMRVTLAVTHLLDATGQPDGLTGTGIGMQKYTGTARVVIDADEELGAQLGVTGEDVAYLRVLFQQPPPT
jgi:hypothetical protein